jgi:AcrR family transcriptional regulator
MGSKRKKVRVRLDPEMRREQILEQATELISTRGFNGFGIQELADRCAVTKGALLYYFGSKDGLLVALLQHRVSRDTAILFLKNRGQRHPGQISLEVLTRVLRTIVELNCSQPEIMRFWSVLRAEALNEGHPARDFFVKRERETRELFASLLSKEVYRRESMVRQFLALMAGLEDQWLRERQGFDLLKEWDLGVAKLLGDRTTAHP